MSALTLTLYLSLASLLFVACSNNDSNDNAAPAVLPLGVVEGEVELEIRENISDDQDNYVQATYSFFHATRDDINLTKNNWELLFSKGRDDKDSFDTQMVVGDIGIIEDLGPISCATISLAAGQQNTGKYKESSEGGYPHTKHRKTAPNFWFQFTAVHSLLLNSRNDEVEVNEGHCYALRKISHDRETMAVFRVKAHNINSTVIIDEIEVFERRGRAR